jgi:hypothetical protein
MCDHERARTSTRFKERPLNQFPPDDIPLVSNYPWRSGDHRLVLADFLVAEAQRLLGRAEVLLSEVEAAGGVTKGNIHSKRVY